MADNPTTAPANRGVAPVVWPWRTRRDTQIQPGSTAPAAATVLTKSAVMVVAGAVLYGWFERQWMGVLVWGLAAVVCGSGFLMPAVFDALDRFGTGLGKVVGQLLTWGLLAPLYYLFFLPMHLILKLRRKDPLRRRLHTGEPTYWLPHKPVTDRSLYRKQF